MDNRIPIYSLSISGRLTLEMHSLNNEGGEGNQTMTRIVTLVDESGSVHKVNAISGDMFKHIQAEHYYRRARESGLPLCAGCQVFDAARILADKEFIKGLKGQSDEETIHALLNRCALDDTEGSLIAQGARSIPRKSVAEFSWVVGLPDKVRTESYFHVRYARERAGDEETSQPIFHRPASSGIYASVLTLELGRIGFNDISQEYAIDEEDRLRRHQALLESVLYTYVEPGGAMRGTQNPHILAFQGAVTVSQGVLPAPALSPLAGDYRDQLGAICQSLNNGSRLTLRPFDNMAEFVAIMRELVESTRPYRMFHPQGG